MKHIVIFLLAAILCTISFSCSDQTYAKQLKAEEKLISDYLQREKINVLHSFPAEDAWGAKDYVALENGMYFHLEKPGLPGDSIKQGNTALVRYKSYTLGIPTDSVVMLNTLGTYYPAMFIWGGASVQPCTAWLKAISCMQRSESVGKIIAPSKTGFNSSNASYFGVSDDESGVTPRLYYLILRFQK